jgi:hypothetical protein
MGFGLVNGFIDHSHTWLRTTSTYNVITDLHTLQITRAHVKSSQSAFTSYFLLMDEDSSDSVVMPLPAVHNWTVNLITVPFLLSLPSRTQLNSLLQLSWLWLIGTDHTDNTVLLLLHSYSLPRECVYGAVAYEQLLFICLCRSCCIATAVHATI